ncbi:uncharacterized protein [Nicotiana tomentosiformis]|uniref:uncharacterized protein n=1 Tax=Nicotiana tomentosiformis TaxID=4098 RepID=UPI00388C6BC6
MGIVESNGVDFVVFLMTGSAKRWWKDYIFTRPIGSPALTWEQFSQLFLEKFLPITLRENYRKQIETHFVDLARHALLLLPTERERVTRFIDGLFQPIKQQMAKETGSEISFQTAANVAMQTDMVLSQERGPV